ncbi:MAG TPA: hypothetical protein VHB73_01900 [Alphaproteobacteria bacterium]|nr:hypothetical protein [Alphaproteobacteria bacterium]
MITVTVYGRNDSHGYNLHKRAALSLNAIAEMLDAPNDEIIFVDYNTPDDLPTFPEAIADILTPRAKEKLRILRVRPALHRKFFAGKTDLVAVESVSRNAAIRRSHKDNRWILATNTDMIFAPKAPATSLGEAIAAFTPGFYELPRFELPDLLWESLDRLNPREAIEKVRDWGTRFHVNEIVHRTKEIVFDAPGDFQLFPRDTAHAIDGFDESHLLGWHMDSNLARRLHMIFGETKSAHEVLEGWHCNHTRQTSILHRSGRINNDFSEVFREVVRADLPLQKESWGFAGETLEEIRLDPKGASGLVASLERLLPPAPAAPYQAPYISTDTLPYHAPHMQVYLADLLYTFPRDFRAGLFGYDTGMLDAFREVWEGLGFTGAINHLAAPGILEDEAARCDIFIGAFAPLDEESRLETRGENKRVLAILEQLLQLEQQRLEKPANAPRKFIMMNGAQGAVAMLMARYTNAQENPFSTRLRHGYVTTAKN